MGKRGPRTLSFFSQEYCKQKVSSRKSTLSDLLNEGTDAEEVRCLAWVAQPPLFAPNPILTELC